MSSEMCSAQMSGTARYSDETDIAPHLDGCFVCGPQNPDGLRIRRSVTEDRAFARMNIESRFSGVPGIAHGGVVAAVMDEMLGTVVNHLSDEAAVTGELVVNFLRPAPVQTNLTAETWLGHRHGRKLFAEGELRDGDTVVSTAQATFLTVDRRAIGNANRAAVADPRAVDLKNAGRPGVAVVLPHRKDCYACGDVPQGLAIQHTRDGDEVVSYLTSRPELDGVGGLVHGGVIAAFFDDALGTVPLLLADTGGMTGRLQVRYHRFASNDGRTYVGRSRFVSKEGRKVTATATMHDGGQPIATARAVFVDVRGRHRKATSS